MAAFTAPLATAVAVAVIVRSRSVARFRTMMAFGGRLAPSGFVPNCAILMSGIPHAPFSWPVFRQDARYSNFADRRPRDRSPGLPGPQPAGASGTRHIVYLFGAR